MSDDDARVDVRVAGRDTEVSDDDARVDVRVARRDTEVSDDDVRVLADELIERGDPCGELLAMLCARDALASDALPARRRVLESRIAQYLDRHHDALFGNLAPHVQRVSRPDQRLPVLEIERWTHGSIDATVQPGATLDLVAVTRALRDAPIGRFVRRLNYRHSAGAEVARAIVHDPFPVLRELLFGWSANARIEDSLVEILAPILPALESLQVNVRTRYVPFDAPRLKKLVLWRPPDAPAARFASRLDAIAHLELADFEFERGLLTRYPTLRTVRLSGRFEPDWLEAFLTAELGMLETVELFGSTFEERDLDVLVRHAGRTAQLAKLSLAAPWENLSLAARDAARAQLPPNIFVG